VNDAPRPPRATETRRHGEDLGEIVSGLRVTKAHAYGNDFLLVPRGDVEGDRSALAPALCDRHQGIGADGLILYEISDRAATMTLFNADGSASELSGNGVRCLAALVARAQNLPVGATITIETDAGSKSVDLLAAKGERYTFRTALGQPEDIRRVTIPTGGEEIAATVLRMGNPQCVLLGPLPDPGRFRTLGSALATHSMFPAGTNVEFAEIETPDRIRILIWERGVGPTASSGTGTAASAVAAAVHGGADRQVDVVAPGGVQAVDWREDGVYLTGWAELVLEGEWLARP
jgi:diaminopimelate epimerase